MENVKRRSSRLYILLIVFLLVAIIGFSYVKWWPYFNKALLAHQTHSIGDAIIENIGKTASGPSLSAGLSYTISYFTAVWKAAVLGLILGSLIQVLLPTRWIVKVFGGTKLKDTLVATALGVPTMMCTCCTAPVATGLSKAKASVNSVTAFFLANPILNPATLVFMGFVLGFKFTFFRLILGFIAVLAIATLVAKTSKAKEVPAPKKMDFDPATTPSEALWRRWLKALGKLILESIPAYVIIVFLLGTFQGLLFPVISGGLQSGILAILFFALMGTLFVIPTAGEVPIIQTLMALGLTGGPAGALLMTLPAVSIVSLSMVKNVYTWKQIFLIFGGVVITGIVGGLLGMCFL